MTIGNLIKDLQKYDPNLFLNIDVIGLGWDKYEYKISHVKGYKNVDLTLEGDWDDEMEIAL